jgi:hypothetical protein
VTVPFERIGPGQSFRPVLQVMGSNGPIYNPTGIRYLPLGEASGAQVVAAGTGGLALFSAGVSLAALGVGVANLAVSAAILRKVNAISAQVDRIAVGIDQLAASQQVLLEQLKRTHQEIAEDKLREHLRYHLRRSIDHNDVDLVALEHLHGDLDHFAADVGLANEGAAPQLRLSMEARDALQVIHRLLWGARMQYLAGYLEAVGDLPSTVGPRHLHAEEVVGVLLRDAPLRRASEKVQKHAGHVLVGGSKTKKYVAQEMERLADKYAALDQANNPAATAVAALLRPVLTPKSRLIEVRNVQTTLIKVADYLIAWRATDAGLVWAVQQELHLRQQVTEQAPAWSLTNSAAKSITRSLQIDLDPLVTG